MLTKRKDLRNNVVGEIAVSDNVQVRVNLKRKRGELIKDGQYEVCDIKDSYITITNGTYRETINMAQLLTGEILINKIS